MSLLYDGLNSSKVNLISTHFTLYSSPSCDCMCTSYLRMTAKADDVFLHCLCNQHTLLPHSCLNSSTPEDSIKCKTRWPFHIQLYITLFYTNTHTLISNHSYTLIHSEKHKYYIVLIKNKSNSNILFI